MDGKPATLRIVVVLAGAVEQNMLASREEYPAIESAIRGAKLRDCIAVAPLTSPRPALLQQTLEEHQPHLIHFCGRGARSQGLFLRDDEGDPLPVTAESLARLLAAYQVQTRGIVLNACHSQSLARAVIAYVDWAIAMDGLISDHAAVIFAERLHASLAAGQSVQSAFDRAVAALAVHGTVEQHVPVLVTRQGSDGQPIPASALFPVDSAMRGHPDHTPPAPASSVGQRLAGRVARAPRRVLALLGAAFALAAVAVALFWPPLSVARFHQPGGVVVACPWLTGRDTRLACDHVTAELDDLGEQLVQRVMLPRLGAGDDDLVDAAQGAGAALVLVIEPGPIARIHAIPASHGNALLGAIPPLGVARPDTRAVLARLAFAMAYSADNPPATLPRALDIPIPDPVVLGPRLAVLAVYLLELAGRLDRARKSEAVAALELIIDMCQSAPAPSAGAAEPEDWLCSMAGYVYFALLRPDTGEATRWLDELITRGPPAIADAATLEIMERRCHDQPNWVVDMLDRLNGAWGERECRRLALAVPAQCIVTMHQRHERWLEIMASPPRDAFTGCGDLRARVLARRAAIAGNAGQWQEAAGLYQHAADLSPSNPAYHLDWAAALVHLGPPDLASQLEAAIAVERLPARFRVQAQFLLWLASRRDQAVRRAGSLGQDERYHAGRLCRLYGDVAVDDIAMPSLGPLGDRLCSGQDPGECQVYRTLVRPRPADPGELPALLSGCRRDTTTTAVP